jgi:hypothetical protein
MGTGSAEIIIASQSPPVLSSIPLCGAAYSSPDANNPLFDD